MLFSPSTLSYIGEQVDYYDLHPTMKMILNKNFKKFFIRLIYPNSLLVQNV